MGNPFRINGPTTIQFSGGRTSAFLLHKCLEVNQGLPEDAYVLFQNTGKERPETLDFVQECSERWSVPITWLEYDREAEHKTRIVNHNSAARNGEPFKALIKQKQFLPNPITRYCTVELKIRRAKTFMWKICGYEHWVANIGLRADEMHRVARLANHRERWETEAPLARAGLTKRDVTKFWGVQPFGLDLPNIMDRTPHGNCDLCFLKSRSTIEALIHEDPASADWWIGMESEALNSKPSGAKFRQDRDSYAQIRDQVERQAVFDFGDESSMDCFCTD
ncbi:MAG: phosphoadenosine phosphosulfate reductase family protein [Geminicoccaceae bacterium]